MLKSRTFGTIVCIFIPNKKLGKIRKKIHNTDFEAKSFQIKSNYKYF
jgi:hypothetical protein